MNSMLADFLNRPGRAARADFSTTLTPLPYEALKKERDNARAFVCVRA